MSQTATGSTLPDPTTAYNHLYESVHAEVFFRKCAAAGYVPDSQEEAVAMLQTAAQLRGLNKQAAAPTPKTSPILALKQAVDQAAGANSPRAVAAQQDYVLKQAADELLSDPNIYNSILVLKAAQAEEIRGRLAG